MNRLGWRARLAAWAWGNCYHCPEWHFRWMCAFCVLNWLACAFYRHLINECVAPRSEAQDREGK
jgi:hypothetical protein